MLAAIVAGCSDSPPEDVEEIGPSPLRGTGTGWRVTPFVDVTLIEVRPQAFRVGDGGSVASWCLAGDLPGTGWGGVSLVDSDGNGWYEVAIDNQAASIGLDARQGCNGARLPYRFGLKECGVSDRWAVLDDVNSGGLFWFGLDDRCVCTGSASLYWQEDNGLVAPAGFASQPCAVDG